MYQRLFFIFIHIIIKDSLFFEFGFYRIVLLHFFDRVIRHITAKSDRIDGDRHLSLRIGQYDRFFLRGQRNFLSVL